MKCVYLKRKRQRENEKEKRELKRLLHYLCQEYLASIKLKCSLPIHQVNVLMYSMFVCVCVCILREPRMYLESTGSAFPISHIEIRFPSNRSICKWIPDAHYATFHRSFLAGCRSK